MNILGTSDERFANLWDGLVAPWYRRRTAGG